MAELTTKRRKDLPKGDFAIPSKAPASGSYPIDTAARARSALSRAAANASPAEQAKIRAAVERKFPSMDVQKPGKSAGAKGSNVHGQRHTRV